MIRRWSGIFSPVGSLVFFVEIVNTKVQGPFPYRWVFKKISISIKSSFSTGFFWCGSPHKYWSRNVRQPRLRVDVTSRFKCPLTPPSPSSEKDETLRRTQRHEGKESRGWRPTILLGLTESLESRWRRRGESRYQAKEYL